MKPSSVFGPNQLRLRSSSVVMDRPSFDPFHRSPRTEAALSTLTESGRKVLRERPGWIKKVNADVRRMGARVVAQYAVLGPYDFVSVIEAADNAAISRVSVELGARGSVHM